VSIEKGKKPKVRVCKEDIQASLRELGLKKGDIVGVHSSLSSLGHMEGGADAVIDALLEVVGEEGTLVMPTYSANRIEVERTQEEIAMGVTWKFKLLPYNPKETPCWTGTIPETFRKRKNVYRSLHPTHSIAATGRHAKEIVEVEDSSALKGWRKLLELDGYILLIGVGLDSCSAMHLTEEGIQLPRHIIDKITPPSWFVQKYSEEEWDVGYGPYPEFSKMEKPCLESKIMKTVKVGDATLKLVKLRDLIKLYAECLGKNPDHFYR